MNDVASALQEDLVLAMLLKMLSIGVSSFTLELSCVAMEEYHRDEKDGNNANHYSDEELVPCAERLPSALRPRSDATEIDEKMVPCVARAPKTRAGGCGNEVKHPKAKKRGSPEGSLQRAGETTQNDATKHVVADKSRRENATKQSDVASDALAMKARPKRDQTSTGQQPSSAPSAGAGESQPLAMKARPKWAYDAFEDVLKQRIRIV